MALQVDLTAFRSEGGVFKVRMNFPPSYPNEPPEMRFDTSIWHPNGALVRIA